MLVTPHAKGSDRAIAVALIVRKSDLKRDPLLLEAIIEGKETLSRQGGVKSRAVMLAKKVLPLQLGVFALARVNVDDYPFSVSGNDAEGGSFKESGQSLGKWRSHLFSYT
jgi:hypothetical protein